MYNAVMKVFISYADQDMEVAKQLASELRNAGYEVWNPEKELLPGDDYRIEENKARKRSLAMIVLLSAASLRTDRVREDINFALGSLQFCNRLIPIQVGSVSPESIPWILKTFKLVRFVPDQDDIVDDIIERLEGAPV